MDNDSPPQSSRDDGANNDARTPGFGYSLLRLLLVVGILIIGNIVFGAEIQTLLFISMLALFPLVMRLGYSYEATEGMAFDAIRSALNLIMILIAVGTLIASWAASGTIAALVHVGLAVVSADFFLPTVVVLCCISSLATGTSWGTAGTLGVAMMGVGHGLGYPAAMTAGAVLSGAYFGDKMSPFSDSTNLTAALVRADLIKHIRLVAWTTGPAIILSTIVFTGMGFAISHGANAANAQAQQIQDTLGAHFALGWAAFVPVLVTFTLLGLRKPALPSIFVGALAGGVVAILTQGQSLTSMLGIMWQGFTLSTGVGIVDDLVSGGGITEMLPLAALFMFAIGMAGLLADSGMLRALITPVMHLLDTRRRLMVTTIALVPTLVGLGSSFSFSAVMSGSLLLPLYDKLGLDRRNLSRIMEDSGTACDAVFPWSGGGLFMAGVLGVATLDYLPYYLFVYFSIGMSLLYAITGWKVPRVSPEPEPVAVAAEARAAP